MRLQVILLWLCASLQSIALNAASPYELLTLYNAYLAQVKAAKLGKVVQTMVTGATHKASNWKGATAKDDEAAYLAAAKDAGVEGALTIDEFTKYIGDTRTFSKFSYDKTGHTISPDWGAWRDKLEAAKFGTGAGVDGFRYNPQKLIPTKWTTKKAPPFGEIFTALDTVWGDINTAKLVEDASISKWMDNALEYARVTQDIRSGDSMGYLLEALQKAKLDANTYQKKKIVLEPFSTAELTSYQEFDYEAKVTTESEDAPLSKADMDKLKVQISSFEAKSITKGHLNVINGIGKSQTKWKSFKNVCEK